MTDKITKRVYVGECVGSRSVKKWIDNVKECLKKEMFGCQATKKNGVWWMFSEDEILSCLP